MKLEFTWLAITNCDVTRRQMKLKSQNLPGNADSEMLFIYFCDLKHVKAWLIPSTDHQRDKSNAVFVQGRSKNLQVYLCWSRDL